MIKNQNTFQEIAKKTKHFFFNNKIQEITLRNKRLWDFMNYVKKQKFPAIEVLQYNGYPSYN